ncbi:hypothetical protein A2U01_0023595 [Trifolium medium]|uniref:Uncharacterized protein n=1 Tax=Trifolium medium TaxID=97028 RepID=A0A392NT05_9FABA|nr:hypothetical protein [Trifolium medium]
MSAKRIQKSTEANSSSDTASFDLFVNSDAEHRFANYINMLDEGKKDDEEEEEKKEKEDMSADNQSVDRPVGLGHEEPTIIKPSGETLVVGEVQVSRDVTEGQSVPGVGLATTDEVAAGGNQANTIASLLKKERTTKSKAAQKAKADKSSKAIPEPSLSAEQEEEEVSEVSKAVGTKRKKKERGEPTRRSARQRV